MNSFLSSVEQTPGSSRYQDSQSGPQRNGIRAALQHHTHAAHVRINRHAFLSGLTKPGYPLDKYRTLLAAYFHIYSLLEGRITTCLAAGDFPFDYAGREKLPWLAADLRHFGIDPEVPALRPGRALEPFTVDSQGALIGTLYAIEGATLGGQVLSRHLRQSLALTASTGARFFNGYGDELETQRRWQEFGRFADSIGDNPEQLRRAEISALGVFELIEVQLDDYHGRLDR